MSFVTTTGTDKKHPLIHTTNDEVDNQNEAWMAIQPSSSATLRQPASQFDPGPLSLTQSSIGPPPSFTDSQFGIIFRRQRQRPPDNSGLKTDPTPSRFLNLSNSFEFAGWGSVTRLKLTSDDFAVGQSRIDGLRKNRILGQFTASALAGNAVLGSVFYALPAVVAVGGV